ncbi:helix-turn-helix domain-containing protein [Zhihengliuella halotolerans]|uniref:helix-turn-helix domain-containing protein n=1 Tax=Zhihengliuella halotolerans TaxID=370736 RepID=UPI000C8030A3
MKRLLDVHEAAELLGMHPSTVREMLRTGDLVGIKGPGLRGKWRIEEAAIERWINRHRYRPTRS